MINTVYELITDVMAKEYPDRVAVNSTALMRLYSGGRRWQDCGGKDLRPVCAGHPQGRYLF